MAVADIASSIIQALTSGLTGLVSAIPTAIKDTFVNLFMTTETSGGTTTTSLSTFAVVCLVFGGIALAFGISKLVYHLVAKKIGA